MGIEIEQVRKIIRNGGRRKNRGIDKGIENQGGRGEATVEGRGVMKRKRKEGGKE